MVATGEGHAELWLSLDGAALTFRVQAPLSSVVSSVHTHALKPPSAPQVHSCPRYKMTFVDSSTASLQFCAPCTDRPDALGAIDAAAYAELCAAAPAPCAAGFYANASDGCVRCAKDTYKAVAGDSVALCLSCGAGSFTGSAGADSSALCLEIPDEAMNYLPRGLTVLGYFLFSLNALLSLGFIGWTAAHRRERMVRNAQPIFLYLVCVGCIISSSTILPLGFDDGNTSQAGADAACVVLPWLYSIGFCLSFAALWADRSSNAAPSHSPTRPAPALP